MKINTKTTINDLLSLVWSNVGDINLYIDTEGDIQLTINDEEIKTVNDCKFLYCVPKLGDRTQSIFEVIDEDEFDVKKKPDKL